MKYSIIIPAFNSDQDLLMLLLSMRSKKIAEKSEIIVVDYESTDNTKEIVKMYGFARLICIDFCSKGKARNEGIKKSTGDVIVNIDSDVEILDGWFEAMKETMNYADIVAGYSPDPLDRQLPRVPIWVDGQDITFPTCNIAYKRSVLDKVGLFNEEQDMAEDCELNYRCVKAGYTIAYNPKMKLYHHQRETKRGFIKQAFINGKARARLRALHPEIKVL